MPRAGASIAEPGGGAFYDDGPAALSLDEESVDRLVAIGRRLLRESKAFQNLLTQLQE